MIDKGLQLEGLGCVRGDTRLFENLSHQLPPGRSLLVRGANGAGKSSLLRLLAGLLRPSAGTIRLNGIDLRDDAVGYGAGLAWLGHQDGQKMGETAAEAVAWRASLAGRKPAPGALAALGMAALADTKMRYLSAGQKQRVALAGVIATGTDLWLLDEPDTALDADAAGLFRAALSRHLANGGMAVIATHGDSLTPDFDEILL